MEKTLEKSQMNSGENTGEKWIAFVEDFLAKLSALQGTEEDLRILEEHYFSKYSEQLKKYNPVISFLKMSKDYSLTNREKRLKPCSPRWTNAGMMLNGKCLTLKTLASHRIGKECLLSDILEGDVQEKYFLSEETTSRLLSYHEKKLLPIHLQRDTLQAKALEVGLLKVNRRGSEKIVQVGNLIDTESFGGNPQVGRVYSTEGISPCLNTMQGGGREPKIIQKTVTENFKIRKLTPKECWRLQGFPDYAFQKAREVNSDSQLYKQAGNSVTVNVVYEIARRLEVIE